MLFTYSAKSKTGEIFESVLESPDRFSLAREIRTRGYTPLSIREKNKSLTDKFASLTDIFSRVSVAEQILFTKNLSGMLRADLSLARALLVLEKQTKNPKLNKILASLSADINAGETFSTALSK